MPTLIKVAEISDIPPGSSKFVEADGQLLALFNIDGTFYVLDDECPHQGAPLSDGEIIGCVVVCPWHGWKFDVTNGKGVSPLGVPNAKTYHVIVEGNDVMVEV